MSLYKRGNVWWSRIVRKGQVHVKSLEVTNKNDARILESKFRTEIVTGSVGLGKAPTVAEFTERFLNYLPPRVAPPTFTSYSYCWQRICEFAPIAATRLSELTTVRVNEFTDHLLKQGYEVATINLNLRVLKHALNLAYEWGIIARVPKFKPLPGENQREFVISREDEPKLLAHLTGIMKFLVVILIDTGMRIEEACRLTWNDMDGSALIIRKGKTKYSRRRIPLTPRAIEILRHLSRPDGQVFFRESGPNRFEPITPKWAWERFVEAVAAAGLPEECVVHSTRHTFCTRLGEAGASAFEIQRLAGHSDIKISARYCHPENAQLDRAVERMAAM